MTGRHLALIVLGVAMVAFGLWPSKPEPCRDALIKLELFDLDGVATCEHPNHELSNELGGFVCRCKRP